jgi:hypothetical protein
MLRLYQEHDTVLLLVALVIAITLAATIYSFWRKHFIYHGPRKGEAVDPEKVKQQNPPDP